MSNLNQWMRWQLVSKIYPRLGNWRPDLRIDASLFDGFEDETLKHLAPRIGKTRYYRPMSGVEGFLSMRERQILYAFGRWHPGPFLEVGSWVGLSTCHIAAGIRDSGERKTFVTAELNPTTANFRRIGENEVGFFYPADSSVSMGSCTLADYTEEIEPILKRPGGVIGTLRKNLDRMGVADLVEVYEGHFSGVPKHNYRFLFVDAMHEPNEIARNAPYLQPLLIPGVVLACHDLKCHPDNETTLRQTFRYGHTLSFDQLFLGEIV